MERLATYSSSMITYELISPYSKAKTKTIPTEQIGRGTRIAIPGRAVLIYEGQTLWHCIGRYEPNPKYLGLFKSIDDAVEAMVLEGPLPNEIIWVQAMNEIYELVMKCWPPD